MLGRINFPVPVDMPFNEIRGWRWLVGFWESQFAVA